MTSVLLQANGKPYRSSARGRVKWAAQRRGDSHAIADRRAMDPARQTQGDLTLRRWESADTNRLNQLHWSRSVGASINEDLAEQLPTLRARCAYEMQNNAMLAGVAATYASDLVGPGGPNLEIHSDSEEYNDWLEEHFVEWWKMPDLAGKLSGENMLRLWVGGLFPNGEFASQMANDPTAETVVKLRLNNIHVSRIENPVTATLSDQSEVIMGVQRNLFGKPEKYHVTKRAVSFGSIVEQFQTEAIDAADMLHYFDILECDQARGVPWFAQALQPAADNRDLAAHTMEAAKNTAMLAINLETADPNTEALPVNETSEIESGVYTTMPPGWKTSILKPEQPGTIYMSYLHERYRDYGRPFSMPLMMVLLDSKGINYSGGRLDTQSYDRGLMAKRSIFEPSLNRLVERVAEEAFLADLAAGKNPPARPDEVTIFWGWQPRPHVDPSREAAAIEKLKKEGVYTVADGLRLTTGRSLRTHLKMLKKEAEAYEAAGLTHPAAAAAKAETDVPEDEADPAKPAAPAPAGGPKSDEEDDEDAA